MRIYDNGTYRDMTPAEIAAHRLAVAKMDAHQLAAAETDTVQPLTDDRKLSLLLGSIPEEPTPTVEPELGYRWQPVYTPSSGFAWELVEDPTALGTIKNPWHWVEGMAVRLGHHYTSDGEDRYAALQDGVPPALADGDWLREVST